MRSHASLMSETTCSRPRVEFLPVLPIGGACAIVASGPSFKLANFKGLGSRVHVIAVKGAIEGLVRADSWITVDANRRCRETQMAERKRKLGTKYYAAVPDDFGQPDAGRLWHRNPAEEGIHWLRRVPGVGLSDEPNEIVTGNSAYAALGLAFHMGFTRIGLFGVDGNQHNYGVGYGGPRGDLSHLFHLFNGAKAQLGQKGVEVRNAGYIGCWSSQRPDEVMRWLNGV